LLSLQLARTIFRLVLGTLSVLTVILASALLDLWSLVIFASALLDLRTLSVLALILALILARTFGALVRVVAETAQRRMFFADFAVEAHVFNPCLRLSIHASMSHRRHAMRLGPNLTDCGKLPFAIRR
jgi:hypothetical protein